MGDQTRTLPERVALVALGGLALSALSWLLHAGVDGALFRGEPFIDALLRPDPESVWTRLLLVLPILIGTAVVQAGLTRRTVVEHALALERARTRLAYENSPDAVLCVDRDLTVTFANARAAELAGIPGAEMAGAPCHEALLGTPEPCEGCCIGDTLEAAESRERTFRATLRSGEERWLSCTSYPLFDEDGTVSSAVEVVHDVTELREAKRAAASALRESRTRHRLLVEQSPDMIVVAENGIVSFVNTAGQLLLGVDSPHPVLGTPIDDLFVASDTTGGDGFRPSAAPGAFARPVPMSLCRPDGTCVDVELTGTRMTGGEGREILQYVARDITERIETLRTIRTMAYYDPLTELPNRTLFLDRLERAVEEARDAGTVLAVAFLDLDDFKLVNDTLTHAVGDSLLKLVGERIRRAVRERDTVARISGDEFTVVAHLGDTDDAHVLARRVLDSISEPFEIEGQTLRITASMGLALFPEHGADPDALIMSADTAMYASKDPRSCSYTLYEHAMGDEARERLEMESQMRRALESHGFELAFQPQVAPALGRPVAVEALLRWRHPARGVLAPGEFLPVAKQSGLMGELGAWVLGAACAQASAWEREGAAYGRIAVNMCAEELAQPGIVERVASSLHASRLSPDRLEIEVTEDAASVTFDRSITTLGELSELGVRISIDDFGTGRSPLSDLKRFPVHALKIAQAIVAEVDTDTRSAGVAIAIIELCRLHGLDVVAEGVERRSQLEFLRAHGCGVIQGNLCCPPRPAEEISRFLAADDLSCHANG